MLYYYRKEGVTKKILTPNNIQLLGKVADSLSPSATEQITNDRTIIPHSPCRTMPSECLSSNKQPPAGKPLVSLKQA